MRIPTLVFIFLVFAFLFGFTKPVVSDSQPKSFTDLLPKDYWQKQKLDAGLVQAVVASNTINAKYWLGIGARPDAIQPIGKPGTLFGFAGTPVLLLAALRGDYPIVQLLLDKGANANATDIYHETALMCAALKGHLNIVNLLIDRGAKVNPDTKRTSSALMAAIDKGHTAIFKLLLDRGADVNVTGEEGITALMLAAANGQADMVKDLLDKGAEVNSRTSQASLSQTALTMAKQARRSDIVALLKKAGATEEEGTAP